MVGDFYQDDTNDESAPVVYLAHVHARWEEIAETKELRVKFVGSAVGRWLVSKIC